MGRFLQFILKYRKALLVATGVVAVYPVVLEKLGRDLWADENYSHGLLVPFVIGYILWSERDRLPSFRSAPYPWLGAGVMLASVIMLIAGTLGAELFTQRISMVLMIAGVTLFFFGRQMLQALWVPFALLVLAIPIPQIVFNNIALPLQMLASKLAVLMIRLIGVPSLRNGNVIDILPFGATQSISLEVVEACSGIRSLMTLVTLALVLVYFTRTGSMGRGDRFSDLLRSRDVWRAVILMLTAVPAAVLTNACRVAATGYLTYRIGKQGTEGFLHEVLGLAVYVVSLLMLIAVNAILKRRLATGEEGASSASIRTANSDLPVFSSTSRLSWITAVAIMVFSAATVNWLGMRGEISVDRRPLAELGATLGGWTQKGKDTRFDAQTESVLRATDYTMRDYQLNGRTANVYIGYYESQRGGATYHSPKNCLPGSGWIMKEPELVDIKGLNGTFQVNRFIVESGSYRAVMLYWYQGRGRVEASEYRDKLNTVWDSFWKRRTDGAMVRIMLTLDPRKPEESFQAAENLAGEVVSSLGAFIPE